MTDWLLRLLCHFLGHDWRTVRHFSQHGRPSRFERCERCGAHREVVAR